MKISNNKSLLVILITILFHGIAIAQINLNNGLVGYFALDSNSIDQSSTAINGVVSNATLTNGKNNNPDSAYLFNGYNANINCSPNNRNITSVLTISAWVKTTSSALQFIVTKYDWTIDKGYHLAIQNGHPILAGRNNGGSYVTTNYPNSNNLVNDGNWHHIVGEISGNSWKIWIDCVLDNQVISNSNSPSLVNNSPLTIGNYIEPSGNPTGFFDGSIDDVRIYNRALTANEHAALCDINYSGSVISAPLVSQDTGVCENELVTLHASSSNSTIYWESPLGVIIDSGSVHSQIITQPTVFYVYGVQNGVSSSNSIITVNMASAIDTSISSNGFSLTSNATSVMYQWIDCENWTLIPSEVGQVFTPSVSGYYALAVTNEYCSDTSDCIQVIPLGINELSKSAIQVYPNPTSNIVVIKGVLALRIYKIEVLDVSGKIISQYKDVFGSRVRVDLSEYDTGMYFIRVYLKESTEVFKVVKR